MSWDTELAKEFKSRNNIAKIGTVLGTVLSVDPVKIGILNNQILIDKSHFYICSSLVEEYKRKATVKINAYSVGVSATDSRGDSISSINVNAKDNYNTEIIFKEILKVGDSVLVIASEDNQTFFIVDKLI